MSEELVKQRIKYLIEHGELYPTQANNNYKAVVILLGIITALQVATLVACAMLR